MRLGGDVECPGCRIDDGSAGDPDLGCEILLPDLNGGDAGDSRRWVDEADMPEGGAGGIGIESVDAVVLGRDEDDVWTPLPGIVTLAMYSGWA